MFVLCGEWYTEQVQRRSEEALQRVVRRSSSSISISQLHILAEGVSTSCCH